MIWILVDQDSCDNEWFVGDLQCDDGNNNEACHFDGGDCCLGSVGIFLSFACSICNCHATNTTLGI